MKYIKNIITGLGILFCLGSCSKWLDVPPADKFTEDQVFTSIHGINQAINGVYLDMAKPKLYGSNLTNTMLEIFAQQYNLSDSRRSDYSFSQYDYNDNTVKGTLDQVWTNAYVNIVNLNKFLSNLDKYKLLSPPDDSLFRGEAIGLRAMLHLDLLRMYGPMYRNDDTTRPGIPYYRQVEKSISPIPPAHSVMDSIIADLRIAEQLLQNDPVVTEGVNKMLFGDGSDFKRMRNYRLNYYAVKTLQARAYLYRGMKEQALEAATNIINRIEEQFPWITPARIISEKNYTDRIFSTEVLFGLFNRDMYLEYRDFFSADLPDGNILAPNDVRLKSVYESNESDYRYIYIWPLAGSKSYRTFYKYAPLAEADTLHSYFMPLIRKSELYYIAAECETDPGKAIAYLNKVRFNRGLTDLPAGANINTELQKEYRKEFYGEGQLFFYYKRKGTTSIPNGNSTSGNVGMNATKYVFPLPLSETQYR